MRTVWFNKDRNNNSAPLLELSDIIAAADAEKLVLRKNTFYGGLNNYLLFQRFNSFYWPLWLVPALDEHNRNFRSISPLHLRNTENRDCLLFTNFLSAEYLKVDPAGMISPVDSCWSIELWVLANGKLHRPQLNMNSVYQERNDHDYLITTNWENSHFKLSSEVYGTRTSLDEAIVDIKCVSTKRGGSGTSLAIAIRPYNMEFIGGLNAIDYRESGKTVRINKKDSVYFSKNPREVFTGSGIQGDLKFLKRQDKISCAYGMSTMALVYPIKKEGLDIKLRLSLTKGKTIDALKLNYNNIRKDFTDYCSLVRRKGFNVSIADDAYGRWFHALKLNALNTVNSVIHLLKHGVSKPEISRNAFYLVKALGRMGYVSETRSLIENWCSTITVPEHPAFSDGINFSYFIASFADHFTITRDTEFLQANFDKLRIVSSALLKHSNLITHIKKTKQQRNSLPTDYTATNSIHDIMLLDHSFSQYSYLCRTIGLFGDEILFNRECHKLDEIVAIKIQEMIKAVEEIEEGLAEPETEGRHIYDENIVYGTFCLFPYHIEGIKTREYRKLLEVVQMIFGKYPLFMRSGGYWDMFLTAILANNLLLNNLPGVRDVFELVQNLGGGTYSIFDRIHPVTLKCMECSSDIHSVNSAIFLLMRNMLLIDTPSRLELFPMPREEWFRPGSEIVIENAPTRFGNINLKIVSTQNEIQIFFNDLPKYIPPDIMINLPSKMILHEGDDFVLKKEEGNAFIINGWPYVVRFGKI